MSKSFKIGKNYKNKNFIYNFGPNKSLFCDIKYLNLELALILAILLVLIML